MPGSRVSTVKTSKAKQQNRKRGQKQCPEGTACPYQHEHQHTGEYAHDNAPKKTKVGPK